MNKKTEQNNRSRREFVKKLAYMPPAIATLTVLPAFHASGSGWNGPGRPGKDGIVPQPPGKVRNDDRFGTKLARPGNPTSKRG